MQIWAFTWKISRLCFLTSFFYPVSSHYLTFMCIMFVWICYVIEQKTVTCMSHQTDAFPLRGLQPSLLFQFLEAPYSLGLCKQSKSRLPPKERKMFIEGRVGLIDWERKQSLGNRIVFYRNRKTTLVHLPSLFIWLKINIVDIYIYI